MVGHKLDTIVSFYKQLVLVDNQLTTYIQFSSTRQK